LNILTRLQAAAQSQDEQARSSCRQGVSFDPRGDPTSILDETTDRPDCPDSPASLGCRLGQKPLERRRSDRILRRPLPDRHRGDDERARDSSTAAPLRSTQSALDYALVSTPLHGRQGARCGGCAEISFGGWCATHTSSDRPW